MKILVTGGGGFLGSAIVRHLLARGDSVRSLTRSDYPELRRLGVEVQQGDIAEAEIVQRAAEGCDAIIHTAAKAGLWGSYDDYYRPNVIGTANVLAACQQQGITRLVYTSSPSVVDHGRDIEGADESLPYPAKFIAAYAETKAMAEEKVLAANGPRLASVALRPPLIWGPGDNLLAPRMMQRAKAGRLVQVGKGDNLLDVTYIDNAADAHLLALDRLYPGSPISGKVYFVSDGRPVQTFEMINQIVAAAGYPPAQRRIPASLAYLAAGAIEKLYRWRAASQEPPIYRDLVDQLTKSRWFDISAARRDLDYRPQVSQAEGMERLRAFFQQQASEEAP